MNAKAVLIIAVLIMVGGTVWFGVSRSSASASAASGPIAGDVKDAQSDKPGLRILFVGNSFTSVNDLPAMVHKLAAGDDEADPLYAVYYAPGGSTFEDASQSSQLSALMSSTHWDAVVLQEQSQRAAFTPVQRRRQTDQYAAQLDWEVRSASSHTVLFMTWAARDGDPMNFPGDTFGAMTSRLNTGYTEIGTELKAPVAKTGLAWQQVHSSDPQLDLWASDDKHPSVAGSYLSAAVLYHQLTGRDASDSSYKAGLSSKTADELRVAAKANVTTH